MDVVLDLMIHDIDIILNIVRAEIESVDAVGIPVISRKVDIANARIKFRNGCVADFTASRISKERTRRIRLFQSDAYISIDYAHQKISISRLKREEGSSVPSIIEDILPIKKGIRSKRRLSLSWIASSKESSARKRQGRGAGVGGRDPHTVRYGQEPRELEPLHRQGAGLSPCGLRNE